MISSVYLSTSHDFFQLHTMFIWSIKLSVELTVIFLSKAGNLPIFHSSLQLILANFLINYTSTKNSKIKYYYPYLLFDNYDSNRLSEDVNLFNNSKNQRINIDENL